MNSNTQTQPAPGLTDWMQEHLKLYLDSGGREGHIWRGVPTLLLTTMGRKSGKPMTLPLIYGECDDGFVVVASKGGAPGHPAWYLNLRDQPEVEVQVGTDKFTAHARTAGAGEKPELWRRMVTIWPDYDKYQQSTSRDIPVVILERQ